MFDAKNNLKQALTSIFHLTWLIIAVVLFAIANRMSYLHAFVFPDWDRFIEKFQQISFWGYFQDTFISLFGLVLFSLAFIGIGLIFLRCLTISGSPLALGVTAFAAGQILLSLLFLSVISLTKLDASFTGIVFGLSIITSAKILWSYCLDLMQAFKAETLNTSQKRVLLTTSIFLSLSLFLTSARLGYDATVDYFSQAKLMALSREAVSFYPENYMIVSSLHPDILFTIIIQLFGDQSARMISWANGIAILITTYLIAEENNVPLTARFYILIILLSSTFFTDLLGDGKVELICTTPILIGIYWMQRGMKSPSKGVFLLIGILFGFAIISRLYNIFLVSFYAVAFYGIGLTNVILREKRAGSDFRWELVLSYAKPILWIFPSLILIGTYHLWQNWLWLGSPFAPINFNQKLSVNNWGWQFDPGLLNTFRAMYPLVVTILNSPQSLGNISPLFIGFLPFLLHKKLRQQMILSQELAHILTASLLTLVLWILIFYTVVEIRYVMFIWVIIFIPLGTLMDVLLNQMTGVMPVASRLVIGLLLGFIALRTFLIAIDTYSPIDRNGQAYCSDFSLCTFFAPVNKYALPGDRVFSLNAFRYYMREDLFVCSSRSNEYENFIKLAQENSPEFWVELYRAGYTFVTYEEIFSVNRSHFGTIPPPDSAPPWLRVKVISSDQKNRLYQIISINPPFTPDISCQKNSSGEWQLFHSR